MKLSKNFWKGAMETREQRKYENVNMERDDKMLGKYSSVIVLVWLMKDPGFYPEHQKKEEKNSQSNKTQNW